MCLLGSGRGWLTCPCLSLPHCPAHKHGGEVMEGMTDQAAANPVTPSQGASCALGAAPLASVESIAMVLGFKPILGTS